MKAMAKGKRVAALAAAAVLAMGGGAVGLSTYSANAYTMEEVDTLEARTPDSLPAMKTQGYRVEAGMINPNFEDSKPPISRLEYGGPWAFANIKDTVGWDKEDYDPYIAQYSTYQVVNINDAVNGMGKTAGQGDKITTALEITINTDNQDTLADALTYNFLDDMMWGEVAKEAFYFTAWVKAEQDMWFDVGMSFGAKEGQAQVYWDLGRRFFVSAGTWTQIGLDKDGNYLPFRAKVTEDGFKRGTIRKSRSITETLSTGYGLASVCTLTRAQPTARAALVLLRQRTGSKRATNILLRALTIGSNRLPLPL